MDDSFFFIVKDNFTRIVGELIREIRTDRKITQEKLGELTGYDRTYIGSVERGEKNVSFYAMYKIFKVLGVDPADFFGQI